MQNIMAGYEKKHSFGLKFAGQLLYLLRHAVPYYLRHLVYRPYRQSVPAINYEYLKVSFGKRIVDAAFDTMYTLMFDGYAEVTGLKVRDETGPILKFLIEDLARHLDEFFDDELTTSEAIDIDEILASPKLKNPCDTLRDYTAMYGASEAVIDHLEDLFSSLFEDYWGLLKKAENTRKFEDIIEVTKIESGIQLSSIIEVVQLFNGHDLNKDAQRDFYSLGMVGKFADDMVDLKRDVKRDRINLLHAVVSQNPNELRKLNAAIELGERLGIRWWRKRCPVSFSRYYWHIDEYYSRITSPSLTIMANLLLLPAVIGYDYDKAR